MSDGGGGGVTEILRDQHSNDTNSTTLKLSLVALQIMRELRSPWKVQWSNKFK